MKNLQDSVLIKMIKQSNHIAFHEFYQRHWEQLYLRAFSILQDSDASEDIVQDVFLEIWNKRTDLNIDKPSQYLFTCVKHAIFKVLQKQKLKERHLHTLNSIDLLVQAEASMDTQEIEQAILNHLDQLPGRCKEIFVMSRFENMSNREIALKLGISTKTVENQIYRALKSLKSLIPQLLAIYLLLIFEDSLIKEFESILTFC
ncbi:RNA polymerase sigma-70 factor [Algoriphagus sp. AGSA1]|uniref:RNA polymerase sigma factor n=1 Tax=Algoriphagus sp. AGSA1 TaxID=2907213 RepID=UPI001F241CB2|nr:RNA polymerase sigma-70 factor [Algoriphagus sp. AGSA1]